MVYITPLFCPDEGHWHNRDPKVQVLVIVCYETPVIASLFGYLTGAISTSSTLVSVSSNIIQQFVLSAIT